MLGSIPGRVALVLAALLALACETHTTTTEFGNFVGTCPAGTTCTCNAMGNCVYDCPGGGCTFSCTGQSNCFFSCDGGNCTFQCANVGNCINDCNGNGCSMTCSGVGNCSLSSCPAPSSCTANCSAQDGTCTCTTCV